MHDARAVKEQVHRYYHATTEDYLKYYETDWHHHMHFGFDRDLPKGGNPTEHLVKYLAALAGLMPGTRPAQGESQSGQDLPMGLPRVLDAGCGVGGSAIWLARVARCRCVGITLVESQARLARDFATAAAAAGGAGGSATGAADGAGPCARFTVNDFTSPAFKPGSFDVVWAVESFDHAPDKESWVREMHALLKPGGRLVIADGFRAERPSPHPRPDPTAASSRDGPSLISAQRGNWRPGAPGPASRWPMPRISAATCCPIPWPYSGSA